MGDPLWSLVAFSTAFTSLTVYWTALPAFTASSHRFGIALSSSAQFAVSAILTGKKSFASRMSAKQSRPHFLRLPCKFIRLGVFITFLSAFKEEYWIRFWCRSGAQLILSQVSLEKTTFSKSSVTFLGSLGWYHCLSVSVHERESGTYARSCCAMYIKPYKTQQMCLHTAPLPATQVQLPETTSPSHLHNLMDALYRVLVVMEASTSARTTVSAPLPSKNCSFCKCPEVKRRIPASRCFWAPLLSMYLHEIL